MTATLHPQTQAQAVAEERQNTAALLHRVRSTPMKVRYGHQGRAACQEPSEGIVS